jgi:hypothetical protein
LEDEEKLGSMSTVKYSLAAPAESLLATRAVPCRLRVARTDDELRKLLPFWMKANRHPDADAEFYSLMVGNGSQAARPHILVAEQNGEPVVILIGRLERTQVQIRLGYFPLFRLNIRQLTFLQDGLIGDCSKEITRALVEQIMECLRAGTADRALFERVEVGTELYRLARTVPGVWTGDYSMDTTEGWKTKLPATLEEFLKRRSKKHRYWLRRIGRVFEEDFSGQVKYQIYQNRSEVEAFCACAEAVARKTYHRGLNVGFVDNAQNRRRLELAGDKGWLRGYVAFIGREPVAFWCGRLYQGVMLLDWTGYDPAYGRYELGTILFLKMVEDLCAAGEQEIDYGSGTSFYKERFGDHKRGQALVHIYAPTARGFCLNVVKALEAASNRWAKVAARKLGIIDRIKKHWRGRLATRSQNETGAQNGSAAAGE